MSQHCMNKKSWESLSSTFSNLEISVSQDSCYASDEVSVTSINPINASTSIASSFVPSPETSLRPFLKPILKRPYADIEDDDESESGYGTDSSDYEFAAVSEEDDDDMYQVSIWDETSDVMFETCSDDDESIGGSFISFESMVRFDSNVLYIEAPEPQEDEPETPRAEMTCHEMMELARTPGNHQSQEDKYAGVDLSDEENNHKRISDSVKRWPEEHTSDVVDLDKRLFVAYMNGINGIVDPVYKTRLRAQVDAIRKGHMQPPYLETDNADGAYLDHVLNHVLGTFRNIVVKEEFDELVSLSGEKHAQQPQAGSSNSFSPRLLEKIEHILSERLATGDVSIGQDELSFFAGGVAYALENWGIYTSP